MQFIDSFDCRGSGSRLIWLSFLLAGFDSLAVGFATDACFLVDLVVGALVAFAFGFLATVLVVFEIALVIVRSPLVCVLFLSTNT